MKLPKITLLHVIILMAFIWISAALSPFGKVFESATYGGFGLAVLLFVYLFLPKSWKQ